MRIVIPGKPKYQKRYRHGKGRTWNPSAPDKKKIKKELLAYKNTDTPLLGPVAVELTAFYPFLKSWSKSHREEAEGMVKTTKPDADNISKLYLDAMNGIIYNDDNQVVDLRVQKLYSEEPCVVIDIESLDEEAA